MTSQDDNIKVEIPKELETIPNTVEGLLQKLCHIAIEGFGVLSENQGLQIRYLQEIHKLMVKAQKKNEEPKSSLLI